MTTRKQEHGPENGKTKFKQTKRRSDTGEPEVPGSIVTYTEEEINTFKASENKKKSTPLAIVLNRGT